MDGVRNKEVIMSYIVEGDEQWGAKNEGLLIRCKNCKHWRQQTDYQGVPLSFGFCESDDMWLSLHGETTEIAYIETDDDHYCGYAKRRTDA